MAIQFDCPDCHQHLQVADSAAGRTATCISCSHRLTIPVPPDLPIAHEPNAGLPMDAGRPIDSVSSSYRERLERRRNDRFDRRMQILSSWTLAGLFIGSPTWFFVTRLYNAPWKFWWCVVFATFLGFLQGFFSKYTWSEETQ